MEVKQKKGIINDLPKERKEILRRYFLKEIRSRINSQGNDLANKTKAEGKA